MRTALDGFEGGFRIGGRRISNLIYADDIVLIATSVEELQDLLNRIMDAGKEYGLAINVEKTKTMSLNGNETKIMCDGQRLEQVHRFRYLGSWIEDVAECKTEVKARLAMGTTVLAHMTKVWKSHDVSKETKIRLMKALIWPVATYGCEAWTYKAEEVRRIEAFEMRCYRRILRVPWTDKRTNQWVMENAGKDRELLASVKKRKLQYFGHVCRRNGDSLEKMVMLGMVSGKRKQGRPRARWIDDITNWTGMRLTDIVRLTAERLKFRETVHTAAYHRNDGKGE